MLLSVVPLFASGTGSGMVGAGLTNGVMMLSTVITQLFTPQLFSRFGQRKVIAVGLLMLSLPTLLLLFSSALPVILGVSILRGAGLATTVVVLGVSRGDDAGVPPGDDGFERAWLWCLVVGGVRLTMSG